MLDSALFLDFLGGLMIWVRMRKISLPCRHFSEKAAQVGFELAISSFKGNHDDH